MAGAEQETWGELGPAMKKLNERQRDFVRAFVLEKPGYGALVKSYRKAGFGHPNSKGSTLSKDAHHLSRDPRIIEAVAEEAKKVLRLGHPQAVNAALALIRDPSHRDHARAVFGLLDRVDPATTKHSVDVVHRVEDPDRVALEELKALRTLGTGRAKLLELYGSNGLDRLEALEAVETAQRAAAAKVIDGEVIEHD
jgi:hypothetical protein